MLRDSRDIVTTATGSGNSVREARLASIRREKARSHFRQGRRIPTLPVILEQPTHEPVPSRQREMEQLAAYRQKYAGSWLALEGDQLVAVGKSLRETLQEARSKGFSNPLMARLDEKQALPFAGW